MLKAKTTTNVPLKIDLDLTNAMRDIAVHTANSIERNFVAGGRPSKWRPLKDGRASYLYKTGALLRSISYRSGRDWASAGTDFEPYAAVHQFGYAPKNIPPRPFVVLQEDDEDWAVKRVGREVDLIIKKTTKRRTK